MLEIKCDTTWTERFGRLNTRLDMNVGHLAVAQLIVDVQLG